MDAAAEAARSLRTRPYSCILRGLPAEASVAAVERLFRLIVLEASGDGADRAGSLSFTPITVREDGLSVSGGVSRESRTDRPLDLHSDGSYRPAPYGLMAMQMIRPDEGGGGLSTLLDIDTLLASMPPDLQETLSSTNVPFRRDTHPILVDTDIGPTIRYYRRQIELEAADQGADEAQSAMLDRLDAVIAQSPITTTALQPGEILVANNLKVLHGRTALSPGSTRVMNRYRLPASSLSTTAATGLDLWDRIAHFSNHLTKPRRSEAKRLAMRGLAVSGATKEQKILLARLLVVVGLFAEAHRLLGTVPLTAPSDAEPLRDLSALHSRFGEKVQAEATRTRAARLAPFTIPKPGLPDRIPVLRLQAADRSPYGFRRNKTTGAWSRRTLEGHFSTRALLSGKHHEVSVGHVTFTAAPLLAARPDTAIIVNTIACAEFHRATLGHLAGQTAEISVPIINPPHLLLRTSRAENARRLAGIPGIRFPRTETISLNSDPEINVRRILDLDLGWPLLVRRPGTQTGDSFVRLADEVALRRILNHDTPSWLTIIEALETRDEHGVFRKGRVFFVDGRMYPVAYLGSDEWQIHSGDRYRIMGRDERLQDEERRFLADPEGFLGTPAVAGLKRIAEKLRLDFFGIDFALSRGGDLTIFEANATMRHNYDHASAFPYTRPHLDLVSKAFRDMIKNRAAQVGAVDR